MGTDEHKVRPYMRWFVRCSKRRPPSGTDYATSPKVKLEGQSWHKHRQ